jgi:hypothetical protein
MDGLGRGDSDHVINTSSNEQEDDLKTIEDKQNGQDIEWKKSD